MILRSVVLRSAALLVAAAATLSAQAPKCVINTELGGLTLARLKWNPYFSAKTPEAKAKALGDAVKALADNPAVFKPEEQPGRNFLLGQVLVTWLDDSVLAVGYNAPRGRIGYTANPTGTVNLPQAIDSAWSAIRETKPECSDTLSMYVRPLWASHINKGIEFLNSQQLDSAEYYTRMSMRFDPKIYYGPNVMGNIALQKEDTTAMIEWFTKTIEVTSASTDAEVLKVRDGTLLNLASVYQNRAAGATGAAKTEATAKAVATLNQYLSFHPSDFSTKLRILRVQGGAISADTATSFVRQALAAGDAVDTDQLIDLGNKLTEAQHNTQALQLFRYVLTRNPWSRDANYNAAVAYNNLDQFDSIAPLAARLRDIDPANPGIYVFTKNLLQKRRYAIQTAANGGRPPRPGARINVTPAQQRQIKAIDDSLIVLNTTTTGISPSVDVKIFSVEPTGAKWAAILQVPANKPAVASEVTVEFLNATGQVVATEKKRTGTIQPGGFEQLQLETKTPGVAAFRYRVAR
jgi:tetratricopeptide (TPR) repeat protein